MSDMFRGQHTFVCGMTQSGKTYFTLKHLEKSDMPVFFFNAQEVSTRFTQVDKSYDIDDIIRYLRGGGKVDYVPSLSLKYSKHELNMIIQQFFMSKAFINKPMIFAIDECHLVAREGANNEYINMIPTRGFAMGFRGVFIAQHPAMVDKTLITQSDKHVIFHTTWEKQYFATKGLNLDDVTKLLGNTENDKHNYVIYERGAITGPYKEN
jgi:hypothetical protein